MKKKVYLTPKGEKIVIKNHNHHNGNDSGMLYTMGLLGALFYFLQGTRGWEAVIWAVGKAIFWPAVLIYKVFSMLNL